MTPPEKSERIPKDIAASYGGQRGYKRAKRRQIEAVFQAFDELAQGCAYLPGDGYRLFLEATRAFAKLRTECSPKKWGG
jgi:hypothetical protein